MKKSISLIMVVCLSSVLMFFNNSKAASLTPSVIASNTRLVNTNTYFSGVDSTDNPLGNYYNATYEGDITISLDTNGVDGYINGYTRIVGNISTSGYSGNSSAGINVGVSDYSDYSYINITNSSFTALMYFDNLWNERYVTLCTLHVIVNVSWPYTGSNTPDPPSFINCNFSSGGVGGSMTITPEPVDQGFSHIITSAINNGDFSNDIDSMVGLLTTIRDNEYSHYVNILSALNTNNGWLEEIFEYMEDWDTVWFPYFYNQNVSMISHLLSLMSKADTIISDLISIDTNNVIWYTRLRDLLNDIYSYMQQSNTGATEAADAADHAASQAAAIAAVPRPNADAIINEGISRIDTDISSGFGVLGAILNQQWYIWILMIVISLAFVSYLMYGKGV